MALLFTCIVLLQKSCSEKIPVAESSSGDQLLAKEHEDFPLGSRLPVVLDQTVLETL